MTKQTLDLTLKQQLVLTPQLQQAIKLLNMDYLQLEHEISQMLAQNFMLNPETEFTLQSTPHESSLEQESIMEEIDGEEWDDVFDDDWAALQPSPNQDNNFEEYVSNEPTLAQFLIEQIEQMPLDTELSECAKIITYHLDYDGYFRGTLQQLANTYQVSLPNLKHAISIIRQCQPSGVGARDLQDCLSLQIQSLPSQTPHLDTLKRIMLRHFHFIGKNPSLIMRRLGLTTDKYERAIALLRSLNPSPGAAYNDGQIQFIKPDIIVREHYGISYVETSDSLSIKLSINQTYVDLAKNAPEQDKTLLSAQLQEAKWFIGALEKRADTIKRVASVIVAMQQDFFQQGEMAMRPLTRQKVAEMLNIHESTVSRAVNGKYLLCKRGVFELRHFFSAHIENTQGKEKSTTAIKALIVELIDNENASKPLSDHKISQLLAQQGHQVARRTISKYREALNIPTSSARRRRM